MENGTMNEKICLVTGANSGIGKVTAKALAAGGPVGVQSAFIPGWGSKSGSQSVTKVIMEH